MKKIITTIAMLFSAGVLTAQDIHFSQFNFAPMNLSPAMAGVNYEMEGLLNYRNQWQSIGDPFRTMGVSYSMRINEKQSSPGFWAGGISFYHDQAGSSHLKTLFGNLNGAYHLRLGKNHTLGAGVQVGYGQRTIDQGSLQWMSQYDGMQYDPSLPSNEALMNQSIGFLDMGTGVVWSYKSNERYMTANDQLMINAGVGAYHVNQPIWSFIGDSDDKLYVRWTGFASALVGLGNSPLSLKPGIMYSRQGPSQEIYFGSLIRYLINEGSHFTGFINGAALSLGAYYRTDDAVSSMLLLEWSSYAVGVSYDFTTSGLSNANNGKGGLEISVRYVLPNPFKGGTGGRSMI